MASGKDWAVVVRQRTCSCAHTCSDTNVHASAVWGPYATEAEAEAKKLELATAVDKAPIVTVLPLSPPLPNIKNKRSADTIAEGEDKNKKTKPTKYQYTCVVAENFEESEIELTICADGINTDAVVDEEWDRLHKYSGCDHETEKDSDEEGEEDEHNVSECVTDSNTGTVYTQTVYCVKDLKEYKYSKVYALVEKCSSDSEIEIKFVYPDADKLLRKKEKIIEKVHEECKDSCAWADCDKEAHISDLLDRELIILPVDIC